MWIDGESMPPSFTLSLVEKVPSPAQPQNSLTGCRGAGYDMCVDRRGVDATVIQHFANAWKPLVYTVSELIDRVQDERGKGPSTHRRPVVRDLICEGRVFCLI